MTWSAETLAKTAAENVGKTIDLSHKDFCALMRFIRTSSSLRGESDDLDLIIEYADKWVGVSATDGPPCTFRRREAA